MKNIFKKAICLTLALISIFSFASCASYRFAHNDVHTPYDDVSHLGKYVRLANYTVKVSQEELKNTMESEIQNFLKSYAENNLIGDVTNGIPNRAIKKGDSVTVSTTIHVYDENGELKPFDDLLDLKEGESSGVNLSEYVIENVGDGTFLPEIENAIIGAWTGNTKYVTIQYDDKVQTEALKNKKVQMTIDIHKVVEVILPEYCDAFVESKTIYKTVAEFEDALKRELIRGYIWSTYVESCVVLKYYTDRVVKFQNELTDYYTSVAKQNNQTLQQYLNTQGVSMDNFNNQVQTQAQGTVKEEMILYFIAERENLAFTAEEYKAHAEDLLAEYECSSVEELESIYTKDMIERLLYWTKAKDFLYERIEFVD